MIYFERDKEHCFIWPALAFSLGREFWVGIGWLNVEIGWRTGDGGGGEKEELYTENAEGRTA